jgi:choline transporter-like protein 2/4/5
MIALTGKNFCTAAKDAMEMIWGNIVKYALVGGIGSAFIIVGKLFVVLVTTCICYYILTRVTYYDSMISSAILPIVLIFIISYAIATIMMSVYGMAMDAILMCYILDEKL